MIFSFFSPSNVDHGYKQSSHRSITPVQTGAVIRVDGVSPYLLLYNSSVIQCTLGRLLSSNYRNFGALSTVRTLGNGAAVVI